MVDKTLPVFAVVCTVLAITAILADRAACAEVYKIGLALPRVEQKTYSKASEIPKGNLAAKAAIEVFNEHIKDPGSHLRNYLRWRFGAVDVPQLKPVYRYIVRDKPNPEDIDKAKTPEPFGTDEEIAENFALLKENEQVVAVIGHTGSAGALKVTAKREAGLNSTGVGHSVEEGGRAETTGKTKSYYDGRMVLITPTATHPDVVGRSDWVFSMTFNDEWLGSIISAYLSECITPDNKNVIMVYKDDDWGTNLKQRFEERAATNHIRLKGNALPWKDTSSSKKMADRIVRKSKGFKDGLGAIVLFTQKDTSLKLIRAIRSAGIGAPIVGTDVFAQISFVEGLRGIEAKLPGYDKESAPDGLGVYAPNPFFLSLARLETQRVSDELFDKYDKLYKTEWEKLKAKGAPVRKNSKYKKPQFPNSAALWYDAALLLTVAIMEYEREAKAEKEAVKGKAKLSDTTSHKQSLRTRIRDNLRKINHLSRAVPGLSGTLYFPIDKKGGLIRDVLFSKVIDGKLIPAYVQLFKEKRAVKTSPARTAEQASDIVRHPAKVAKPKNYVMVQNEKLKKVLVVFTGLDFYRINDLDLTEQRFDAEFLLWFRWKDQPGMKPLKLLRGDGDDPKKNQFFFWNGIYGVEDNVEQIAEDKPQLDGSRVSAFKVKSTFIGSYTLAHYPYDEQELSVEMSLADSGTDEVLLATDQRDTFKSRERLKVYPKEYTPLAIERNHGAPREKEDGPSSAKNRPQTTKLESKTGPPELADTEWRVSSGTKRLPSSLGDPVMASYKLGPEYSVTKAVLTLKRGLFPYFLQIFIPLGVLTALSLLAFLVPAANFEVRITLCITALLSTIVFHLSRAESLPNVGYFTVADLYFISAYMLMLVNTFMVIVVKWVGDGPAQPFATHLATLVSLGIAVGSAVCITVYGLGKHYWEWAIGTGVLFLLLLAFLCQRYSGFLSRVCNRLGVFWPKARRAVWAFALIISSYSMYAAIWQQARWAPAVVAAILFLCVMLECIFRQDLPRVRFEELKTWLTKPERLEAPWAPVRIAAWAVILIVPALLANRGLIPGTTSILTVIVALAVLEIIFSQRVWEPLSEFIAHPSAKLRDLASHLNNNTDDMPHKEKGTSWSARTVRHCYAVASKMLRTEIPQIPTAEAKTKELELNGGKRKTLERYRKSQGEQQDSSSPDEPQEQIDSSPERPLDAVQERD
ncbi:hypothetical protein ACFL2Q_00845 [Thermodesulfobacteriota bacterium]